MTLTDVQTIEKAIQDGKIIEFTEKGLCDWKMVKGLDHDGSIFLNYKKYDFRVFEPTDSWLYTVANHDASLANRVAEWLGLDVEF